MRTSARRTDARRTDARRTRAGREGRDAPRETDLRATARTRGDAARRADATVSATRGDVAKAVGEGCVATRHALGATTYGVTTDVTTDVTTTDVMRHGTTASRADRAP